MFKIPYGISNFEMIREGNYLFLVNAKLFLKRVVS